MKYLSKLGWNEPLRGGVFGAEEKWKMATIVGHR
jgi:hypothetical protein